MAKQVFVSQQQLKSFENMVVIIPKSKWYIVEGERKPSVECPKCGEGLIGDAAPHRIFADGTIKNSAVCQNPKCDFHSYIKLDEWTGGNII